MPAEFEFQSANNDYEGAAALFSVAVQSRDELRIPEPLADTLASSILSPMRSGGDAANQSRGVFDLAHENVPGEEALDEGGLCTPGGSTKVAYDQPLVRLAPGPWVSLGGDLNYEGWKERERFVELDCAIAVLRSAARTECQRRPSVRHAGAAFSGNWPVRTDVSQEKTGYRICQANLNPEKMEL